MGCTTVMLVSSVKIVEYYRDQDYVANDDEDEEEVNIYKGNERPSLKEKRF
jgi:hypothetical protein